MNTSVWKLGTRGSALALTQAKRVIELLTGDLPSLSIEKNIITTPGDRDRVTHLDGEFPDDFFTRDLDDAILSGAIDLAQHSAKDLPEKMHDEIGWLWLPGGADPRDCWITKDNIPPENLLEDARVGFSSPRRKYYIMNHFPTLKPVPIRGNVDERLTQLNEGKYDALILATAGLLRLELDERITQYIPLDELPPPPGQGKLAITYKKGSTVEKVLNALYLHPAVLVGAGPGAPELLTGAGMEAMAEAECVLYDRLTLPDIRKCSPRTEWINVGKEPGAHIKTQDEINTLLEKHIRRGGKVVRLKGGDPYLFGRGAEETQYLKERKLSVRVIPGVSALTGASVSGGVTITHRGTSSGVTVVQAHRASEDDFVKLASIDHTLVFFMGVGSAELISSGLIKGGYPPDQKVAVIERGTWPEEKVLRTTVGELVDGIRKADINPPALIIVGPAAGIDADWHKTLPLSGLRVLLPAREDTTQKQAKLLAELGARPLPCSAISYEPIKCTEEIAKAPDFDWIILTSPLAVDRFFNELHTTNLDSRSLKKIAVVGPATAEKCNLNGIIPDVQARQYHGLGLVNEIKEHVKTGERALMARSEQGDANLIKNLSAIGLKVNEVSTYRTIDRDLPDHLPEFDVVFFSSPSAFHSLKRQKGLSPLKNKILGALGPSTEAAIKNESLIVDFVAKPHTSEGFVHTLRSYIVSKRFTTK